MASVWGELEAVLREQLLVLQDLISVGEKKAGILVEGKAQELETLVQGEQVLAWRLGRLEEKRLRLQAQVAVSSGEPADTLTMRELQELAPAEVRPALVEIGTALGEAASRLHTLNEQNRVLLQGALAYTEFAIQLLRPGNKSNTTTYGPKGQAGGKGKGPRLVDGRA